MNRLWLGHAARWGTVCASTAVLGLLAAGGVLGCAHMVDQPRFPAEVDGWRHAAPMRTYDRDTVFDYMDGAGEIYLAYDFRRVRVQEYQRPGLPGITAETYEMSTSQDAYGVFTHDPDGEDVAVGQDSAYAAGLLRFWKGNYFFRILADADTPQAKAAIVALARSLAEPVARGPRPAILDRLPSESLEARSVRYFHTQVSLDSFHYLADANVLALSPGTQAVLAVYRPNGEKMTLLIVRYPDSRQAGQAYRDLDRVYLEKENAANRPLRIEAVEDRRHVGALVDNRILVVVLGASSRAACERLLTEVIERGRRP